MDALKNRGERRIDEVSQDLLISLQQLTKQFTDIQQILKPQGKETLVSPSPTSSPSQVPPKAPSMKQVMVDSDDEPTLSACVTHTYIGYNEHTP